MSTFTNVNLYFSVSVYLNRVTTIKVDDLSGLYYTENCTLWIKINKHKKVLFLSAVFCVLFFFLSFFQCQPCSASEAAEESGSVMTEHYMDFLALSAKQKEVGSLKEM